MKKIIYLFLLSVGLVSCNSPEAMHYDALKYVDTQIGATHCRWFFYTPAALPFGLAKLAPSTNGYDSMGSWLPVGYDDRQNSIEGFVHLHEFQIGGISALPTTGEAIYTYPGSLEEPDSGYRSRFNKSTEQAKPGYYSVILEDYGVKAELTATKRVGFSRYTYPANTHSRILFDIGHKFGESGPVVDTSIKYNKEDSSVSGYLECYPTYATFCDEGNTVKSYFYAKVDKVIDKVYVFKDSVVTPNVAEIGGKGTGMLLEFETTAGEVVEMRVGLSFTSLEGAKLNYQTETQGQSFDKVKEDAFVEWNSMLTRIEVEGNSDIDKTKFYTGLYHALLGRGISNDVDGSYITHDKQIAKIPLGKDGKPMYNHHNTDGMWGGFWNLTQLWTIAYPEVLDSYIHSTIDFAKHTGGWLHDGEAAGVYTNGVQTNFQGLIASAAYLSGVYTGDSEELWKLVLQDELGYENRPAGAGRSDNAEFVKRGYVPLHDYILANGWKVNFGASHTLEYSFAAYAASQLAQELGKTKEADELKNYAEAYRNLFDAETKCIRPKEESGEFMADFDPMKAWLGFQEGNAVQYSWYAPHDIAGLMNLMGKEEFNRRLEETFDVASKTLYGGKAGEFDSFSGVEMLYNHGNQPCLHNAWLFNYSGKPWLTQYYTRDICNQFYGTKPTHGYGFGQDEDQGQLGAWFVMAAMGIFDVQGLTNRNATMQLGSPLFEKITIHLSPKYYDGGVFVIDATNNMPDAYYIQGATLNGEELNNCFFPLRAIQKGGKLHLGMGTKPNKVWGVGEMPPSMSDN